MEIEHEIEKLIQKGTIVLVGAGVAGKIYCDIAKKCGGIGLDMGSTLDAWAGIDSRGSGFSDALKEALNI